MDTNKLKKFAQEARRVLMGRVKTKLDLVLAEDSAARRERPAAVRDLENRIREVGKAQVIEQVAYTWFNRFTALQYMDMNGYNRVRVIAPAEGQTRPEILSEATAGIFNEDLVSENTKNIVSGLLDGRSASNDPENEAYRHLVVSACNYWHKSMPYMFEKILDFTELLMPEDLLSATSILTSLREVMTEEVCEDVEVIGWLYQFYISEKKDDVFAGLKKNQKITPENIPAATQLFTPHWIVRYLVENSLGRLWMLNRPQSKLAEQMEYYIKPEEPETDFIKIGKPQELKICDPACGSGHMLTYAFDLLHAIYEEEGFDPKDIPEFILEHNLTGIEIDERAGSLASFALAMKAAEKLGRRRFLRMETKPDICVLQNVSFEPSELQDIEAMVGRSLFTADLRATLTQFGQAKNFGSLIIPKLKDPQECLRVVAAKDLGGDMFRAKLRERLLTTLRMAEALSSKYHVVAANPPYMGAGGMNENLAEWAKLSYPNARSDVFAMFILRAVEIVKANGYCSIIVLPSWMFLSSFEKFRHEFLSSNTLQSLLHMGRGIFGIDWGSTAFIAKKTKSDGTEANFFKLYRRNFQYISPKKISEIFRSALEDQNANFDFSEIRDETKVEQIDDDSSNNAIQKIVYRRSIAEFLNLPGFPLAYWIPDAWTEAYQKLPAISDVAVVHEGIKTRDNGRFVRLWYEVNLFDKKWKPYAKGGDYRRWYGNNSFVLRWDNQLWQFKKASGTSAKHYELPGITYSAISSGNFSCRYMDNMFFGGGGSGIVCNQERTNWLISGLLHSKPAVQLLTTLSPTLNFEVGTLGSIPVRCDLNDTVVICSTTAVQVAKSDWDAYETSWDFTTLPLLLHDHRGANIAETYAKLRSHWQSMTDEMQRLEEENNKIFIDAYGLQDELTPEVPIDEITLTCNPHYRYGGNMTDEEREARLLLDTMAEFMSYAVGCMFGRYSLDKPGLVLANQGETLADYLAQVPEPTFEPDEDNVIPMLAGDWFSDDITERFRKFLRVTFGEEKFQENLRFIETALGKDIRKHFTKDFYADHVKRYKKRPIYWMFSSPKGSFNALIYMQRYNRDTVSVLLDRYVREFKVKLNAQKSAYERIEISSDASQGEKTKAIKEIQKINSIIEELDAWEREVIFPLASQRIEIDLDDGVKANYPKFGTALKSIGI